MIFFPCCRLIHQSWLLKSLFSPRQRHCVYVARDLPLCNPHKQSPETPNLHLIQNMLIRLQFPKASPQQELRTLMQCFLSITHHPLSFLASLKWVIMQTFSKALFKATNAIFSVSFRGIGSYYCCIYFHYCIQ